jgi:hypothetical protein
MDSEDLVARFHSLCDVSPLDIDTMGVLVEELRALGQTRGAGWLGLVLDVSVSLETPFLAMMQETLWCTEGFAEPAAWPLLLAVSTLRQGGTRTVYDIKNATVSRLFRAETKNGVDAWIGAASAYNALRVACGLVPYSDPHLQSLMAHCRTETQDVPPPWRRWGVEDVVNSCVNDATVQWEAAVVLRERSDKWNVGKPTNAKNWTSVHFQRPGKYYCAAKDSAPGSMILFTHGTTLHNRAAECVRSDGALRSAAYGIAQGEPMDLTRIIIVSVEDSGLVVHQPGGFMARIGTTAPVEAVLLGLFCCGLDVLYTPHDV